MFKALLTHIIYGNIYTAIECVNINEGMTFNVMQLKKSRKEITIHQKFQLNESEVTSHTLFSKIKHAVVIINTSDVITKQITGSFEKATTALMQAFPNVNLDDVYYSIHKQGVNTFVSLCRKELINRVLQTYFPKKMEVLEISLGHDALFSTLEYFDSEIITSNATITQEDGKVVHIKPSIAETKQYDIDGLSFSHTEALSFSAALNKALINNTNTNTNLESLNGELLNNFFNQRLFKTGTQFGLSLILIILLINFFAFNHYYNELERLKELGNINASTKSKVIELQSELDKKQRLISDFSRTNNSKSSFYLNAIVNLMPISIQLEAYQYQPLLKNIKPNEAIRVNNNTIVVSGISIDSDKFTNWISDIKALSWVEDIRIISYGNVSNANTGFAIQISIDNDLEQKK